MRLLHQAVLTPERTKEVVPGMFTSLASRGVGLRAGELSLIAGAPGSGKSSLALALAVRSGTPTLYFSADSTQHTQMVRLLAMTTGMTQYEAEQAMLKDRQWASQTLATVGHIAWDTDANPSLDHIDTTIEAFTEFHGDPPGMIIVDNLADVAFYTADEFGSLRALNQELRRRARDTGAAVVGLHHTREDAGSQYCPPQSALSGKISQVPTLVLTLSPHIQEGFLGVSPVKHRYGKPDPLGNNPTFLIYDAARMTIEDLTEAPSEHAI